MLNSYVFASFLMAGAGMDIVSGAAAVIATMGNIGPGLDTVGPVHNYADIAPFRQNRVYCLHDFRPSGAVYRPGAFFTFFLATLKPKRSSKPEAIYPAFLLQARKSLVEMH
jgi:hypothetical protein